MSSRIILFVGAAAGAVVGLHLILTPRAFRLVMKGLTAGITVGLTVAYMNYLRQHSMKATYVQFGVTGPPPNYREIEKDIFTHLSKEYEERGELDLGEEEITVRPHVFAQIGILDIEGVRRMWRTAVMPSLHKQFPSDLFQDSQSSHSELEKKVVFCDIGCGVGNVCLQVLAETKCDKVVGIDIIPSRIRAAEEATKKAKEFYPEVYNGKEARFIEEDLVDSVKTLTDEGVNVVFTHSWMFDDDVMSKLSTVINSVPSITCVVTSRKLDTNLLTNNKLELASLSYFSADWNQDAPFYVYNKKCE